MIEIKQYEVQLITRKLKNSELIDIRLKIPDYMIESFIKEIRDKEKIFFQSSHTKIY